MTTYICIAAITALVVFIVWMWVDFPTLQIAPEPTSEPDTIEDLRRSAKGHREALTEIHKQVCDYYIIDPVSTAGGNLHAAIYDGDDWTHALDEALAVRYPHFMGGGE